MIIYGKCHGRHGKNHLLAGFWYGESVTLIVCVRVLINLIFEIWLSLRIERLIFERVQYIPLAESSTHTHTREEKKRRRRIHLQNNSTIQNARMKYPTLIKFLVVQWHSFCSDSVEIFHFQFFKLSSYCCYKQQFNNKKYTHSRQKIPCHLNWWKSN